jgi:hypothetical protein
MWVTQVYSPCDPSGEDAEGYWNLILQQMRELKEGGEEMQEDEKGKLSAEPYKTDDQRSYHFKRPGGRRERSDHYRWRL